MTKLPLGPQMVVNKAGDGWTHRVQRVDGYEVTVRVLSGEEDGDGHQHFEPVTESVDSIGIRFDHVDGRAAVALWWRRQGKDSYAFTGAVRGRHVDELVPAELNATELKAYLSETREDEDMTNEDKDRPPRDLTHDDLAVIRSVGVMCMWGGRAWRWDGRDWQPVPWRGRSEDVRG